MFQKLRLWLAGQDTSGLREAAREGAREAVREGFVEGAKLGLEEALAELSGLRDEAPEVRTIETRLNGNGKSRRKATAK